MGRVQGLNKRRAAQAVAGKQSLHEPGAATRMQCLSRNTGVMGPPHQPISLQVPTADTYAFTHPPGWKHTTSTQQGSARRLLSCFISTECAAVFQVQAAHR